MRKKKLDNCEDKQLAPVELLSELMKFWGNIKMFA